MCVYPPRPLITSLVILTLYDWLNSFATFQLHFMAFSVDAIERRGPSNEMHH